MKCIKLVKEIKGFEVGDVSRVSDLLADKKVKDGFYAYVSKSEWKGQTKGLEVDKEMRKAYPANVDGSPAFNKANAPKEKKVKVPKEKKENPTKKKHS